MFPKIGIFEFFSRDELYKIHTATLTVLEKIGIAIDEPDALTLLSKAGADVDLKTKLVKVPQYLVEEAIKKAPRSILFAGRNPKYDLRLEDKRVHFGLGGGATKIFDLGSGSLRLSVKEDVAKAARLADGLPNIDFVMSLVFSGDVPRPIMSLHDLDAMLNNTEKPIIVLDYGVDVTCLIKMAAVVVGGREELRKRPILCMYSEPISPLTHGKNYTRNLMTFAKAKLPVVYIPSPMSGATAPVTIAGAIVQSNAETLSGNVIAQLTNKGAPFIYGTDTTVMDMKTTIFSYGAPEWMMINLAMAQLGRYYRLPIWSTGGCSDSKVLDGQAIMEATLTLFMAAASGANLIHDVGFLEFGTTGSLELMTICDELISMVERILRGIDVTDDTLALDIIAKVGPGGNYMTLDHTRNFFRKEHWITSLLDRRKRDAWMANGSKDLVQRAREKTKEILATHIPSPLPNDIKKELGNIIKQAERGCG